MVEFRCRKCGQKFRMSETHAGKTGKCPKCQAILRIPRPRTRSDSSEHGDANRPEVSPETSPYDLTLLNVPPMAKADSQSPEPSVVDGAAYEQLRRLQGGALTLQSDEIPQRKLPWIVDIFFYPLNKPGVTIIFISVGIPLTLRILSKTFLPLTLIFWPMLIFLIAFIIAHWVSLVILLLYMNWYVCACIYDSAVGGIRAPETAGSTLGLWAIFRQTLKIVACLVLFLSPASLYFSYTQRVDPILWALYGGGGFLFPMGLLAVVMFDSLRGLSPRLILASIFSTFFQYCGLVVFWCGLCVLIPVAGSLLWRSWILGYLFLAVAFYLTLILAHLLGRFFWKYQDKLYWEV